MRLQRSVRCCFGRRNPYSSPETLPIVGSTAESVDSRCLSRPPTTPRLRNFLPGPTTGLKYPLQAMVACRITDTFRSDFDEMGNSLKCCCGPPSRSLARILYSV